MGIYQVILVLYLSSPSLSIELIISASHKLTVVTNVTSWMTPYLSTLSKGFSPTIKKKHEKITIKSKNYTIAYGPN